MEEKTIEQPNETSNESKPKPKRKPRVVNPKTDPIITNSSNVDHSNSESDSGISAETTAETTQVPTVQKDSNDITETVSKSVEELKQKGIEVIEHDNDDAIVKGYYIGIICGGMETKYLRHLVKKAKILANNLVLVDVKPEIVLFESVEEYKAELVKTSMNVGFDVSTNELVCISKHSTIINQTPFAEHGIPTSIVRDTIVHGFSPFIKGDSRAQRRATKKQLKGRVRNKPFNR